MRADDNSCNTKENPYHLTESALFDGGGEILPAITESALDNTIAADYCLQSFPHPSNSPDSDSAVDDEEFDSSVEYDEDESSPASPRNISSPKQVNSKFLSNIVALVVSCCCYNNSTSGHHSRRNLVWVQISLCVVTLSPCFWCLPRLAVETTTDRTIVHRLIILSGFMTLLQIGQGIFFSIVLYAPFSTNTSGKFYFEPNLWNPTSYLLGEYTIVSSFLNYFDTTENPNLIFYFRVPMHQAIALIGVILLISTLLVTRAIRRVNLPGLVRFYWALRWLLPLELFASIGLLDYHNVTQVFVVHWFSDTSFEWFNVRYCMQPPCNVEQVQHDFSRTLRIIFICNFALGMIISFLVSLFPDAQILGVS